MILTHSQLNLKVATAQSLDDKLLINAGHGLTCDNVNAIAKINGIYELNIGHALIADAVFVGLESAVIMMKEAMHKQVCIYGIYYPLHFVGWSALSLCLTIPDWLKEIWYIDSL